MAAGQYFEPEPAVASRRSAVTLALPDLTLTLATDRGVFAHAAVDPGTRLLLLEAPHPPATGTFLDLGCGYGPIACALARRAPQATVWAVDVNGRARTLCAENAAAAGATGVRVGPPDAVPAAVRFDLIWSNPPVRVGKAAMHALLTAWLDRLTPAGRAVLVVHKHLGADSLAVWLAARGFAVDRLVSRQGYRLLSVAVRAPASRTPMGSGGAAPEQVTS